MIRDHRWRQQMKPGTEGSGVETLCDDGSNIQWKEIKYIFYVIIYIPIIIYTVTVLYTAVEFEIYNFRPRRNYTRY